MLPSRDFKSLASAIPPHRHNWRYRPDSNWGIKVLQTLALPLGDGTIPIFYVLMFFLVTTCKLYFIPKTYSSLRDTSRFIGAEDGIRTRDRCENSTSAQTFSYRKILITSLLFFASKKLVIFWNILPQQMSQ